MLHYTNTNNPIDFPKSMLKRVKGNLIDMAEAGEFDIIVQGCNCFCTMGSGIAKEIRARYPEAYDADYATEMGDMMKLGSWTSVKPRNFIIVNAYTQYGTSKNGEDVFEYGSFEVILKKLAYAYPKLHFGFPYIGMGLAGGSKTRIIAMLDDFAQEISAKGGTATLVEFG